jgi:hypothetical protein
LAAQSQISTVEFDQGLRDWQSETGTLMFAGQVIGDLLEGLENSFDLLGGDADPRISDREHQISACVEHRVDLNTTSRLRKLNRIRQEI